MTDSIARDAVIKAAERADWQQVVLNGGPPCFHLAGGTFCLRAERWPGHGAADHEFVSLASLLALVSSSQLQEKEGDHTRVVEPDNSNAVVPQPAESLTPATVTSASHRFGCFESRVGDWVAVPGEDGEDDSWGIRHADETQGMSIAQMMWNGDARMVAHVVNNYPALEKAEAFLEVEGYRRCDIPACNCGSWHQTRHRPGWTEAKVQRVGIAAFGLFDWFKARNERPDEWMRLFSEIVIADDQAFTLDEIRRTHELIAEGKLPSALESSQAVDAVARSEGISTSGPRATNSDPSSVALDRQTGWQPIENAIKDGRYILALGDGDRFPTLIAYNIWADCWADHPAPEDMKPITRVTREPKWFMELPSPPVAEDRSTEEKD